MDERPPEGCDAALLTLGVRLTGGLGAGGAGPRWTGEHAGGRRVVVTVVRPRSPVHAQGIHDRARRLAVLVHPALARVRGAVDLPGSGMAVIHDEVDGTDLLTVAAGRASWAAEEVVAVLAPLAGALAALHGAGLCHGDVSPGNVVLTPDGRAVLVDLVSGDDTFERGTPGLSAPERVDGARAPGDVHALARIGLQLLGDAGAASSAPSSPGSPATAGAAGSARLRRCLEVATGPEPSARPGAAVLQQQLLQACPAGPITVPDPAVLARTALRRRADVPSAATTHRVAQPRRGRHRSRRPRRRAATAAVGGAVVLGAATGVAVGTATGPPWWGDPANAGSQPSAAVVTTQDQAVAAAVGLTYRRARALADGDLLGLLSLTVPGSPAARADLAAFAALGHDVQASTLQVDVTEAARLTDGPGGPGGDPTAVRVRVSARATARVHGDAPGGEALRGDGLPGDAVPEIVAGQARPVVLVMVPTGSAWRVAAVESTTSG